MNSAYRWVIVAVGALVTCVAIGAMFSLAVFLGPMSASTGWGRATISTAMTLDFLIMGVAGFAWGAASDRFGARIVVLCGAVLLGLGLLLASRATSPVAFQLGFGVLVGVAAGAFFAPLIAAVTAWFDTQRALAVSLVSVGAGVAPLTVSPFAAWLIQHDDWRTAMAIIGAGAWVLLIPAALLLRAAPRAGSDAPIGDGAVAVGGDATGGSPASSAASTRPGSSGAASSGAASWGAKSSAAARTGTVPPAPPAQTLRAALASPQFLILGLTYFFCCAAHSGPIFHVVSYAIACGVPTMAAVSIYSLEGLAGLGGRILFGVAADRLGVKPILIVGLLIQSFAISGYLLASQLNEFYMLSIVFGGAYGGIMPLYAVLARDYFEQRIMGAILGAATMLSSLGMAIGPVVGGWVFDTYHDYRWLYVGSVALALAGAAIAFAFPAVRGANRALSVAG